MEMKSILNVPFNMDNYNSFVLEFFNEIDRVEYKEIKPNASFANTIEYYSVHGTYKDPEGNDIIILSVKVKNNSNARQAQRNFVSYLLTNDFNQYSAAMVAFFDDVRTNWKLSFVTVEMELSDDGIELKFKPAKRFSFLVGANEPTRTYTQQLGPIYSSRKNPTLNQITEAFSVTKLSKDFYEDYKKKYFELYDHLIQNNEFITEAERLGYQKNEDKEKFAAIFCKKVLGQIVFLHFVQKKGWLGVEKHWGDGDKKYLIHSTEIFEGKNYFNDFLEPLFYEGLNLKRENDLYLGKKIPFLNGGLFSPIQNYNWNVTDFQISNDYWYNSDETGFLNILSQYNFTIDETDPSEQEVAIDPEMLGKIFESLLDAKDRSNLGAHYTPREIVHYICEETLANRVANELGRDSDSILNYIRFGDALIESTFIEEFAQEIDDIVSKFTVLDPAVGSGAFLVGMLNQIVQLRQNISVYFKDKPAKTKYQLKLETIKNSLYGVDIECDAVEIAKLRLWLSLIVDQETIESVPSPLPNLNYNLRVGDSVRYKLFGLDFVNNAIKIDKRFKKSYKGILNNIYFLKKEYFFESDAEKKKKLFNRIEDLKIDYIKERVMQKDITLMAEVTNFAAESYTSFVKPYFLWSLDFSEVFSNEGFDIVVMNPPFVESVKMVHQNENLRNEYKKLYKSAKGNWDLFVLFIELSLMLTNSMGSIGFIVPNKLIGAKYAEDIRNLLQENNILSIRDYSNVKVFKEASVYPVTAILSKVNESKSTKMSVMESLTKVKNEICVPYSVFSSDNMWDKYFYSKTIVDLVLKLEQMNKISNHNIQVFSAATVNEAYEIKKILQENIEATYPLKKFINTGTIDPFVSLWNIKATQYIKEKYVAPVVKNDILNDKFKKRFLDSNKRKLIVGGMCKRIECFYDEFAEYLPGKSTIIITSDEYCLKSLVCILNSKLINFFYQICYNSASLSGGFFSINYAQIERIPLPSLSEQDKKEFQYYYDLYIKDVSDRKLLDIINKKVYEVYNVNEDEIKIIEKTLINYY